MSPVEVRGLEHLAPNQAYVFAANHRSNFDIFTLIAILPGRLMFVAKQSLFRIPLFGHALIRMGSVPLDRSNLKQAVKSLDRAAARVKAGASMIIFPEGTRVAAPELSPFKKGVFIMAAKAGQPIVPVSISGTRFIQVPHSHPDAARTGAGSNFASHPSPGLPAQGRPDGRGLPGHRRQL